MSRLHIHLTERQNIPVLEGLFTAMANPCQVLIATLNQKLARRVIQRVFNVATTVEKLWSRYRSDSIVYKINNSPNKPIRVDNQTADMLDYAAKLWDLSAGKFDISSGVLRTIWRFDGKNRMPTVAEIDRTLVFIGWQKVQWDRPYICLPEGMQIDFGGIGKEYAVDRALQIAQLECDCPILINFGGDIGANKPLAKQQPWQVGIEHSSGQSTVALESGGVATSGNTHKFIRVGDTTYSHILNPLTGWALTDTASSITVVADSCTVAGMLSTLAILEGRDARQFLQQQKVQYIVIE